MIVKYSVITSNSKFLLKPIITKFNDEITLLESFNIIKTKFDCQSFEFIEFLAGTSTVLDSLDLDCISDITLSELKKDLKGLLHIKVVLQ